MINIATQEEIDAGLYTINLHLLGSDIWRLCSAGKPDVVLNAGSFDFSLSFNKLIFSFWTDDTSQSWRVTGYQIKANTLNLRVARQMGQTKATFEIRPNSETMNEEEAALPIKER